MIGMNVNVEAFERLKAAFAAVGEAAEEILQRYVEFARAFTAPLPAARYPVSGPDPRDVYASLLETGSWVSE